MLFFNFSQLFFNLPLFLKYGSIFSHLFGEILQFSEVFFNVANIAVVMHFLHVFDMFSCFSQTFFCFAGIFCTLEDFLGSFDGLL